MSQRKRELVEVPLLGSSKRLLEKMYQRNGYQEIRITLHPLVSRLPGLFPRTLFTLPSFFSLLSLSLSLSPSLFPSLSVCLSVCLCLSVFLTHSLAYSLSLFHAYIYFLSFSEMRACPRSFLVKGTLFSRMRIPIA